ncbi:glycoside hydrolase family 24 [Rhodopseudomonas palustris TIE-1]|uniref:lysozyme n=1 Tax=Rhodopseudomonas palustris TaxID=1076 RepID=UPI0001779783|nr:lysozyme [Rhodopseudomonas palustris]ACF01583.1 glycoside hydrolase family 24 [Rhodopseudomonas palustris TIE-1]
MAAVTKRKVAGLSAAGAMFAAILFGHWEGMSLVARHLPFDPPGVITVCGGITNYDWPWLKVGMKFTEHECIKAQADAMQRYGAQVAACVPGLADMPPHRQAALASFAGNLGAGKICNRTDRYKRNPSIAENLNAGRVREACDAMVKFVYANGTFLQGLLNRRTDAMWGERPWCLRED